MVEPTSYGKAVADTESFRSRPLQSGWKECIFMQKFTRQKSAFYITRIGALAAISTILFFIEFPLGIFPAFYQIDLSTYPVLLGTFALGPIAGLIILFIKDLIHFLVVGIGATMGVGELSDFLISACYIIPAALIYRKIHSKKGAMLGMLTGLITASIIGSLLNYFVFIPLFAFVFAAPISAFVGQGSEKIGLIKDLRTLVVFATLPFNLIKFTLISILVTLTYKSVSPLLKMIEKD